MKPLRKNAIKLIICNWLEVNLNLVWKKNSLIRMQFDWFFISKTTSLRYNSFILVYKNASNKHNKPASKFFSISTELILMISVRVCTEVLLLCSRIFASVHTTHAESFNKTVYKYLMNGKRIFRVHHNVMYWDDIRFRLKSSVGMQFQFVDAYLNSYQVWKHKLGMWKHRQSILRIFWNAHR